MAAPDHASQVSASHPWFCGSGSGPSYLTGLALARPPTMHQAALETWAQSAPQALRSQARTCVAEGPEDRASLCQPHLLGAAPSSGCAVPPRPAWALAGAWSVHVCVSSQTAVALVLCPRGRGRRLSDSWWGSGRSAVGQCAGRASAEEFDFALRGKDTLPTRERTSLLSPRPGVRAGGRRNGLGAGPWL